MNFLRCFFSLLVMLMTVFIVQPANAAKVEDYISNPPFSTASVPPNVVVMLDNSGSMKSSMYGNSFNPDNEYYGIFNSESNYAYITDIVENPAVAVDDRQYGGEDGDIYDVKIDTTKAGAFVVDDVCVIEPAGNCWSGNFLNWLTTRRIDSARMVLVGGKVENRDGLDTTLDGIADTWKIVGNNEPEDRDLSKSNANSATLSPFPSASFTLSSPAQNGSVVPTGGSDPGYDPYGKLLVVPGVAILEALQSDGVDASGDPVFAVEEDDDDNPVLDAEGNPTYLTDAVGEIGQTPEFDDEWTTVTFATPFPAPPIVVAGPLTYEGADPSVLRIQNITATGFQIRVDEYELKDQVTHNQAHTEETAYYIAIEKGTHQLADGPLIYADDLEVGGFTNESYSLDATVGEFASDPVVLATPVTQRIARTLTVRLRNIDETDFQIGLQPQEATIGTPVVAEKVAYLAVEQGEFADWEYGQIRVGEVPVAEEENDRGDFTPDLSGGFLLASLQTYNGSNPVGLRMTDNTILVEEDTSLDDDGDHNEEDMGYFHLTIDAELEYNVAVLVTDEPIGLMHDVYEDVRLGVSFYNYQYRSSNIYNSETNDGGTLRLKMPLNPFVKKAWIADDGNSPNNAAERAEAETRFRTVDTYLKGKPTDTAEGVDGLLNIVDAIEHYPLVWGTTPIAENLVEVTNYFKQSGDSEYGDQVDYAPYEVDDAWDPFVINHDAVDPDDRVKIDCLDSYILIFTDGEPYKDGCVPTEYIDFDEDENSDDGRICDQLNVGDEGYADYSGNEQNAQDNLDDVGKYVYETDLRDDIDNVQNLIIYTVGFADGNIRPILQDTADNAGGQAYAAQDGKTLSSVLANIFIKIQNQASSGTAAGVVSQSRSGVGAIYQALFYQKKDAAEWIGELQTLLIDDYGNLREDTDLDHKLTLESDKIVVFQDDGTVDLYLDPLGMGEIYYNCEEQDAIPAFATCPGADTDCNGYNDAAEEDCDGDIDCLDALVECRDFTACTECGVAIEDVDFLWKGSNWLNAVVDPQLQRSSTDFTVYGADGVDPNDRRYLFTFVDEDKDMVVDADEQIPFACEGCTDDGATVASLTDSSLIFPYLTLYSSLDGSGESTDTWSFPDNISAMMAEEKGAIEDGDASRPFTEYLQKQSMRLVGFVRGEDQDKDGDDDDLEDDLTTIDGEDGEYVIPAFRKRTVDDKEWRLGDAVYSTPTMLAGPAEGYNLLYRDLTYAVFAGRYQYRRGVVYMGTNDGIFHAFNAGFFREEYIEVDDTDPDDIQYEYIYNKFWEKCELDDSNTLICDDKDDYLDLGAELWGYIPYNLLPHLYWLSGADYDATHVYYADLKPRIFDAKIFEEEDACTNPAKGRAHEECVHPYGWGTVLVGGMRLGGGEIRVDMNKADETTYTTYDSDADRTMSSAYFVLDITNPEAPPNVLAELSFPGLGFTTCYPTAVPVRDHESEDTARVEAEDAGDVFDETTTTWNKWYLVFGNGPDDLDSAASTETGKLYVVDLNRLGKSTSDRTLFTLRTDGTLQEYDSTSPTTPLYAQQFTNQSFVTDPIAVDYDLDFKADVVYFGTVTGNEDDGWAGKMRRLVLENSIDMFTPSYWDLNSILIDFTTVFDTDADDVLDVGQPITAAASVALDTEMNRWVFFGTGRYFVESDEANLDQQSYYGIKEPQDGDGDFTWSTVDRDDLFNATDVWVFTDETITDDNSTLDNWEDLLDEVSDSSGWYLDFSWAGERNIGQAALLGEVLTFTTYVPPDVISNPCLVDGESFLYALYYETGTSYTNHIFNDGGDGGDPAKITKSISIGKGLAISPNLHVGRSDGSKAVLQTSTGAIKIEQQDTPGNTKSGKASWLERR